MALFLFAQGSGHAEASVEERMPTERFATFVARLMTYNTQLQTHAGGAIVIAVLFDGKDPASVASGTNLAVATRALELTKILNRPVKTLSLPVTDAATLRKSIDTNRVDAFVVAEGSEKWLDAIKAVSKKDKILTIGIASQQVRAGLSVAVYLENGKSKILVNLGASKSEGVVFSIDLLRLSEVIP